MRFLGCFFLATGMAWADAKLSFEKEIEPLLDAYCIDCHGDGREKGEFSMDEYRDITKHLNDMDQLDGELAECAFANHAAFRTGSAGS